MVRLFEAPWTRVLMVGLLALGCGTSTTPGVDASMPDAGPSDPTCTDGTRNQDESDVDCGGACGATCEAGEACVNNSDCATMDCGGGMCQVIPTCDDGTLNGSETDVDCGGPMCMGCATGFDCLGADDCDSGVCRGDSTCADPACDDTVMNGDESDVDCGGATCSACSAGGACLVETDCISSICDANVCAASCADAVMNADETDVDCGGGTCDPCTFGQACVAGTDCDSTECDASVCTEALCDDAILNGDESDLDCGGATCPGCLTDGICRDAADCAEGVCTAGLCVAPACDDGVQNGGEADIDCAGPCPACADGSTCVDGADCESGVCDAALLCAVPACDDGVSNGDETGVDCGGPTTCPRCPDFQPCTGPSDCATGACTMGFCGTLGCMPFRTPTDPFGYFGCTISMTPATLPCPDISATGTAIPTADDSTAPAPIGFTFPFYGTTYTTATISPNGGIVLGTGGLSFSNACFPRTERMIAAFWDDLFPPSGGTVKYETRGTAPNRQFIVRWNVHHIGAQMGTLGDITAVLEEGGDIRTCFANTNFGNPMYDAGASATVGISGSGANNLQYSCNTPTVTDGLLVLYNHP